jgi:hypothetical protein
MSSYRHNRPRYTKSHHVVEQEFRKKCSLDFDKNQELWLPSLPAFDTNSLKEKIKELDQMIEKFHHEKSQIYAILDKHNAEHMLSRRMTDFLLKLDMYQQYVTDGFVDQPCCQLAGPFIVFRMEHILRHITGKEMKIDDWKKRTIDGIMYTIDDPYTAMYNDVMKHLPKSIKLYTDVATEWEKTKDHKQVLVHSMTGLSKGRTKYFIEGKVIDLPSYDVVLGLMIKNDCTHLYIKTTFTEHVHSRGN